MHFAIDPTGCCVRKGMVQVRFNFFLDAGDSGYGKVVVSVPDLPEVPYKGPREDFGKWIKALPKKIQVVPFHSHLVYVEPSTTAAEIDKIGSEFMATAFSQWSVGIVPKLKNKIVQAPTITQQRVNECISAVKRIKGE